MSDENLKAINIEYDMLKGNINRMCTTDDKEELLNMYTFAITRINRIYKMNKQRLLGEKNERG